MYVCIEFETLDSECVAPFGWNKGGEGFDDASVCAPVTLTLTLSSLLFLTFVKVTSIPPSSLSLSLARRSHIGGSYHLSF